VTRRTLRIPVVRCYSSPVASRSFLAFVSLAASAAAVLGGCDNGVNSSTLPVSGAGGPGGAGGAGGAAAGGAGGASVDPSATAFGCPPPATLICPTPAPGFAADVLPILDRACNTCHDPALPGDLWPLHEYTDVFAWKSLIIPDLEDCSMPPPDAPAPLPETDRQLIFAWLVCGSPDN